MAIKVQSNKLPDNSQNIHIVRQGQGLFRISKEHNCTINDILEANPGLTIDSTLKINQKLNLPAKKLPKTAGVDVAKLSSTKPKEEISEFKGDFYKVQKGDTFESIAKKFWITKEQLMNANQGINPRKLVADKTVLKIPEKVLILKTVDENDETFKKILKKVLDSEGGLTADEKTNMGIKQETYDRYLKDKAFDKKAKYVNKKVKNISQQEVKEIYYNYYYLKSGADKLKNKKTAYILTDTAIQHGINVAKRLKDTCGDNKTLWLEERKKVYQSYVRQNPYKKRHMEGWMKRLNNVIDKSFD